MAQTTAAIEKEFWKSKKMWVGIVGALVPVINNQFESKLQVEEVLQILTPLFAYIVGQGFADFGKNKSGGKAGQEKPIWKSKKFITAVLGAAVPLLIEAFNIELPTEAVYGIVGSVAAYVTGQGFADFGKNSEAKA